MLFVEEITGNDLQKIYNDLNDKQNISVKATTIFPRQIVTTSNVVEITSPMMKDGKQLYDAFIYFQKKENTTVDNFKKDGDVLVTDDGINLTLKPIRAAGQTGLDLSGIKVN